jgi:hypothetical protein
MTAQDIAERSEPTPRSLRVNWFRREPGGTTIFVMPPDGDAATVQPITEGDDGVAAAHVG